MIQNTFRKFLREALVQNRVQTSVLGGNNILEKVLHCTALTDGQFGQTFSKIANISTIQKKISKDIDARQPAMGGKTASKFVLDSIFHFKCTFFVNVNWQILTD